MDFRSPNTSPILFQKLVYKTEEAWLLYLLIVCLISRDFSVTSFIQILIVITKRKPICATFQEVARKLIKK